MNVFQSCSDSRDAVDLYRPQGLYLKPNAKVHISVQLPPSKQPGKNISNWEVMEKLKHMVKPSEFGVLKVSKSTIEFIRFEGEVENKSLLSDVLKRLDLRTLKLAGFSELLKIRAAEAKIEFPTRHSWDSYFRDAKNMNEMKPGERPDTLHVSNLPCKWFYPQNKHGRIADGDDKPDECVFRKVFEKFGEIRFVDVPMCDPYRSLMKAHISGIKMFSFGQDHLFEGYVQYKEYMGFVNAMDSLRGMKLLHKDGDRMFTAGIKVDFDKTNHLSDASIRRRQVERDKLMALERERDDLERLQEEEKERTEQAKILAAKENQRLKSERRQEREERRKRKQLRKLHAKEAAMMNEKIATEERKLLQAQRQLEAIRLLDFLFERVKEKKQRELIKKKEHDVEKQVTKGLKKKEKKEKKRVMKALLKKERLEGKERDLRTKLLRKVSTQQEQELEEQRERLRKTVEGKRQLKSVLAAACVKVGATAQPPALASVPAVAGNVGVPGPFMAVQDPNFAAGYAGFPGQWFPPNGAFGFGDSFRPPFFGCFPGYPTRGFFPRGRNNIRAPRRARGFRRGGWQGHQDASREYYNYFSKLAKDGTSSSRSRSRRSRSRGRSHSRSRSRDRSRSYSRSRSRSRSRRSRSRSRAGSRRRNRSRSNSRHRSHSRLNSRRKSHSRSHSKRRSCSRSNSRRKSRSRSNSVHKSHPRLDSRQKSRSKSGSRTRQRTRSHSKPEPPSEAEPSAKPRARSRSSRSAKSGSRQRRRSCHERDVKPAPGSERSWSQQRSPALSKVSSFTFSDEESPRSDSRGRGKS